MREGNIREEGMGKDTSYTIPKDHSSISKAKQDNEYNERSVSGTVGLKFGFTIFLGSK
jgi:hypothetical protein